MALKFGAPSGVFDFAVLAPHDAAQALHGFAAIETVNHLGKGDFAVAAMHVVHLRTSGA